MKRRRTVGGESGRGRLGVLATVKVVTAMALIFVATVANAVQVILVQHNQTSGGGTISTLITDGSHISGIAPPSTAVFDWDGTTLTSTGLYSTVSSLNSSTSTSTILSDQITDLSINTATQKADATAYVCVEGTFLANVGANGCGGYSLGANFIDESTTVWGPGLAVSQTIGGDDVLTDGPRTIAEYDFILDSVTGTGLNIGDEVRIGNGIPLGLPDGELMTFVVTVVPVPATAWLFGSALGLLGWMRRRSE